MARKAIAFVLGVLAGIAGVFFFVGYTIFFSFSDHNSLISEFSNPNISFREELLDVVLLWGIPVVALFMSFRFLREAFPKRKLSEPQSRS